MRRRGIPVLLICLAMVTAMMPLYALAETSETAAPAEHSGYQEAGADYGMNPAFMAPPDPEAYYNGLLGVKIIPYSAK